MQETPLPVKKKTSAESHLKIASGPTLVMATKLMKAADKHGMTVKGFMCHNDLIVKEGMTPNRLTDQVVAEASHLMRVWDHNIQEKVFELGGVLA